jgi:hypothetical protein
VSIPHKDIVMNKVPSIYHQDIILASPNIQPVHDCVYDEMDLCFECNKPKHIIRRLKPKTLVDIDRAYRKRQKAQGIVRKTVRVPAHRWVELQAIVAKMREDATTV